MGVRGERRAEGTLMAARRLSAALAAGALAGILVGGVGGRVAMFVLRLTSDPALRGRLTDDGFTIGIVSTSTLFLLGATTILGAMGGLAYLLVRRWLPEPLRPWLFGTLTGLVGGAAILRPGGIDFTLLDPLALAVAMFIAIPALGGAVTSVLAERFLRDGSAFRRSRIAFAPLVFLVPIALIGGPIGLLAIGAVVLLVLMLAATDLARPLSSTPVTWLGRAGLVAVGTLAFVGLAKDVSAIL